MTRKSIVTIKSSIIHKYRGICKTKIITMLDKILVEMNHKTRLFSKRLILLCNKQKQTDCGMIEKNIVVTLYTNLQLFNMIVRLFEHNP